MTATKSKTNTATEPRQPKNGKTTKSMVIPDKKISKKLAGKISPSQPKNGNTKVVSAIMVVTKNKTKPKVEAASQPEKKNGNTKKVLVIPDSAVVKELVKNTPTIIVTEERKKRDIPKNPKCSWSHDKLISFYFKVTDEITEIHKTRESVLDSAVNNYDGSNGLDDYAGGQIVINKEVNANLVSRLSKTLSDLHKAAERILNGEFSDKCFCGNEIAEIRLGLFPGTTKCAACARF